MTPRLMAVVALLLTGCHKDPTDPQKGSPSIPGLPATPVQSHMNLLVMGQSNAVRFSPAGAQVFNASYVNASVANCAVEGTLIDQWVAGGQLYNACMAKISNVPVDAIFYYQGESDAMAKDTADTWAQKFTAIVRALQAQFPGKPIVFAQIDGTTRPNFLAYWTNVQDQQASISLPGVTMIKTSDIPYDGDIHLPPSSEEEVARRLIQAL
jgi:hypothetical protein